MRMPSDSAAVCCSSSAASSRALSAASASPRSVAAARSADKSARRCLASLAASVSARTRSLHFQLFLKCGPFLKLSGCSNNAVSETELLLKHCRKGGSARILDALGLGRALRRQRVVALGRAALGARRLPKLRHPRLL